MEGTHAVSSWGNDRERCRGNSDGTLCGTRGGRNGGSGTGRSERTRGDLRERRSVEGRSLMVRATPTCCVGGDWRTRRSFAVWGASWHS